MSEGSPRTEAAGSPGGWRDAIVARFSPAIAPYAPVTVVMDPDRLLSEQRLLSALRERGFEVVAFEDPISLRYIYERRFRPYLGDAGSPRLVISTVDGQQVVPFDLYTTAKQASRLLRFDVAELFPQLSPGVVSELERDDLDALYRAQRIHQPGPLGENATRDFILRHVCEVAPELIRTRVDLLRVLLRRHYQQRQYAPSVDQRFIALLRSAGLFSDWPLEVLVTDRGGFFAFLQERWERFLRAQAGLSSEEVQSGAGVPDDLPFSHPDVKVYIDNLCLEGVLKPVRDVPRRALSGTWLAVGTMPETNDDSADRLRQLTTHLAEQVPGEAAVHSEWATFAYRFAEWNVLRHQVDPQALVTAVPLATSIQCAVDAAFEVWLLANYGSLSNLSYLPRPVMVHHIVRSMAHGWSPALTARKKALVVIDGLAIDQWLLLRDCLGSDLEVTEGATFAWIPTLTAVSRQAIFAGESPLFFATSLATTSKEERLWIRFWENHGVRRGKAAYIRQKAQEDSRTFVERVIQCAQETACSAFGVVVGVLDDTIHGMAMGTGGLHAQVRFWAQKGYMRELVESLVELGFEVHITADHGNIEARGMGRPNVGVVAEHRGERVHVLPDASIRDAVHSLYPESIVWPATGLPDTILPLLARGRRAFIGQGETAVCHGGLALEEVVVPYIRVTRKS